MGNRISGPLIFIAFAFVALLWPFLSDLNPSDIWQPKKVPVVVPAPTPTPSTDPKVDKIIAFCMDDRHADSILCTVKNPESVDDLKEVTQRAPQVRFIESESGSDEETRIVERSTTRVEQPTAKEPEPEPEPRNNDLLSSVKIPEVEVPEVEVPEVELPPLDDVEDLTDRVTTAKED